MANYMKSNSISIFPINQEKDGEYVLDNTNNEKKIGYISQNRGMNILLRDIPLNKQFFDDYYNNLSVAFGENVLVICSDDGLYFIDKKTEKVKGFKRPDQHGNKYTYNKYKYLSVCGIGPDRFVAFDGYYMVLFNDKGNKLYKLSLDPDIDDSEDSEDIDCKMISNGRLILIKDRCFCYLKNDTIIELIKDTETLVEDNKVTFKGINGMKQSYHDFNDIEYTWFCHNSDGTSYISLNNDDGVNPLFNTENLDIPKRPGYKMLNREFIVPDSNELILNKDKYIIGGDEIRSRSDLEFNFRIPYKELTEDFEFTPDKVFVGNRDGEANASTCFFVLDVTGRLYFLGDNTFGVAGIGSRCIYKKFVEIKGFEFDGNIDHIVCVRGTGYLITKDGNLWVSGLNYCGESGSLEKSHEYCIEKWTKINEPELINNVSTVVVNDYCNGSNFILYGNAFLLTRDKNLWFSGYSKYFKPYEDFDGVNCYKFTKYISEELENKVEQIYSRGPNSVCVIDTEKNFWFAGLDYQNGPGLNNTSEDVIYYRFIKVEKFSNKVDKFYLGRNNTIIKDTENKYWCIGRNTYGELGLGHTDHIYEWIEFNSVPNIKKISFSSINTTIIIDEEENFWIAGYNYFSTDNFVKNEFNKIDFLQNKVKKILMTLKGNLAIISEDDSLYINNYFSKLSDNYIKTVTNSYNERFFTPNGFQKNVKDIFSLGDNFFVLTKDNKIFSLRTNNQFGYTGNDDSISLVKDFAPGNNFSFPRFTRNKVKKNYIRDFVVNKNGFTPSSLSIAIDDSNNFYYTGNIKNGCIESDEYKYTGDDIIISGFIKELRKNNKDINFVNNIEDIKITYTHNGYGLNQNSNGSSPSDENNEYVGMNCGLLLIKTKDKNLYTCGALYQQVDSIDKINIKFKYTKIDFFNENVEKIFTSNASNCFNFIYTTDKKLYFIGYDKYGMSGDIEQSDIDGGYYGVYDRYKEIKGYEFDGNIKEMFIFENNSFILTNDDNLWACGQNINGETGVIFDGETKPNIYKWTQIKDDIDGNIDVFKNNVRLVSIGDERTYLLTKDCNLYFSGGANSNIPNGLGGEITNKTYGFKKIDQFDRNVLNVKNSRFATFVLLNDMSIKRTGGNFYYEGGDVTNNDFVRCGGATTCLDFFVSKHNIYLYTDYTNSGLNVRGQYCLGRNIFGEIGDGTNVNKGNDIDPELNSFWGNTRINEDTLLEGGGVCYTYENHTFIRSVDMDKIYAVGLNQYNQCGTTEDSLYAKLIDFNLPKEFTDFSNKNITSDNEKTIVEQTSYSDYPKNPITISSGRHHTLCIDEDEMIWVCGANIATDGVDPKFGSGQIGFNSTTFELKKRWSKTTYTGKEKIKFISAITGFSSFFITEDLNLYQLYDYLNSPNTFAVVPTGTKTFVTKIDNENINNKVVNFKFDFHNFFIFTFDGKVYGFGYNINGGLGLGDNIIHTGLNLISGTKNIVFSKTGYESNIFMDNSNNIYFTGRFPKNQELTEYVNHNTFEKVAELDGIVLKNAYMTYNSIYIVDSNNNLYVCGSNFYGELGLGHNNLVENFIKCDSFNENVKYLSDYGVTSNTQYLIDMDNNLWVSGKNTEGQCGINNFENINTWTKIPQLQGKVKSVYSVNNTAYCLDFENYLWVCGENSYGECGLGHNNKVGTWTRCKYFPSGVREISVSKLLYPFIHVIDNNGTIWVCGCNEYGELGIGSSAPYVSKFTKISDRKLLRNFSSIDYENKAVNSSVNLITGTKNIYPSTIQSLDGFLLQQITEEKDPPPPILEPEPEPEPTPEPVLPNYKSYPNRPKYIHSNYFSTFCVDEDGVLWVAGYNSADTIKPLSTLGFDDSVNIVNKMTKIPNFSNKVLEVYGNSLSMKDNYLIDENRDVYLIRQIHDDFIETPVGVNKNSKTYINKLDIPEINGKAKYIYGNTMFNNFICLTTDNKIYGFGSNESRALGIGVLTNIYDKIKLLSEENIESFYPSLQFNLFINENKKLFGAGIIIYGASNDDYKSIINDFWTDISHMLLDSKIKDLCINDYNVYIIDENDNLLCFGFSGNGSIGVELPTSELSKFIKIDKFNGKVKKLLKNKNIFSMVFRESYYEITTRMMIIDKDNNLWVTGFNKEYNLGLGHNENVLTWTQVTRFNGIAKDIFICQGCSYCLDIYNNLWSCGSNVYGACGTNTKETVKEWTKVKTFDCGIKNIEAPTFAESIFIIDENYNIWVCGDNRYSNLGIGKDDECITEFTKYIEE